ncbi:MAG: phosphatase PAP2 family protein [Oscillospiraceae bacterium]|nr:phosphatase PAP2 family protein [Oscillospiraceae bacterium]
MEMNAAAIWINNTFAAFDQWMVVFIHKLYEIGGGFFTPFFEFISELGHGGIPLIILSLILMIFRRTRRYGTAMLIGLTIGALITNCCLKILIARARPYSEETAAFFNTDLYQKLWLTVGQNVESDKSFPSGHTTAAFASMTALFLTGNKKYSWTAFIFALLMAVARIYLVVHFASDVVAGIVVGVVAGILASLIAKKIPAGYYNSDWPFRKKEEGGKHVRVG